MSKMFRPNKEMAVLKATLTAYNIPHKGPDPFGNSFRIYNFDKYNQSKNWVVLDSEDSGLSFINSNLERYNLSASEVVSLIQEKINDERIGRRVTFIFY